MKIHYASNDSHADEAIKSLSNSPLFSKDVFQVALIIGSGHLISAAPELVKLGISKVYLRDIDPQVCNWLREAIDAKGVVQSYPIVYNCYSLNAF